MSEAENESYRQPLIGRRRLAVESLDCSCFFRFGDDLDAAKTVRSLVAERLVEVASISRPSGDLTIEFGGRALLQLLQMSFGYESWRLSSRMGLTICPKGGEIVHRLSHRGVAP